MDILASPILISKGIMTANHYLIKLTHLQAHAVLTSA